MLLSETSRLLRFHAMTLAMWYQATTGNGRTEKPVCGFDGPVRYYAPSWGPWIFVVLERQILLRPNTLESYICIV